MESISKQATQEIRFILEGIKEGRLEHNQESYHCGTAHCIAGWCYVFALQEQGYDVTTEREIEELSTKIISSTTSVAELYNHIISKNPWAYTQNKWGLNDEESQILFHEKSTIETQFKLLETLESGYRIVAHKRKGKRSKTYYIIKCCG